MGETENYEAAKADPVAAIIVGALHDQDARTYGADPLDEVVAAYLAGLDHLDLAERVAERLREEYPYAWRELTLLCPVHELRRTIDLTVLLAATTILADVLELGDTATAAAVRAAINGDTVPAPTLPEDVGELVRLKSWKAEATEVIAGWERVWDAMGRPGRLGRPKSEGCLEALVAASPVPDLPSWVSMHEMATGADLIEHDPNGDEWGRWHGVCWSRHHADTANPDDAYLVRRRPQPSTPATERVPWGDALRDRRMVVHPADEPFRAAVASYDNADVLTVWDADGDLGAGVDVAPDGTVEVLVESDR